MLISILDSSNGAPHHIIYYNIQYVNYIFHIVFLIKKALSKSVNYPDIDNA
ncbi:hypothetical protein SBF1_8820001 [Candidatus Desulfosporosinus infrequens]|uniref:Uncharacterized protein n=1 Tax=Candidatus Desulfosporosinus infrequens TaxID=2043169 RepID=A0A2U3LW61_9FIRM|nr:hypothetical protein SBF1_8820001 [Candidatus Desulfosporosinus infrequens]